MLTRFHLWFWNIIVVNNRWLQVALLVLVPCCINFIKALWVQVIAYLMGCLKVMHSLEVVYDMLCIPSLTSWTMLLWMSSSYWILPGALSMVLTYAAIQVVYTHYMLAPSMECLWYVKFCYLCFKQEDQSIEWTTKGQAMVVRINFL